MRLDILNRKETKQIQEALIEAYGCAIETKCVILRKRDEKLYLVTPDCLQVDDKMLRIDTMGMYFGTYDSRSIRLTIEGSQLIGPKATKGFQQISKDAAARWLKGEDIEIDSPDSGYVLVRSGDDFLGSGKVKDRHLLNFIPKTRRVGALFEPA